MAFEPIQDGLLVDLNLSDAWLLTPHCLLEIEETKYSQFYSVKTIHHGISFVCLFVVIFSI